MEKIYFVGGSKGGVGKSIVSMALLDYLMENGGMPLLIETDTSNSDVEKSYGKVVPSKSINLDWGDGWVEFLNSVEAHAGAVVLNGAARNNAGVGTYGGNLGSSLGDLRRSLVTLWVVNTQRDGLELLREYLESLPQSEQHTVHILRNNFFGRPEQFEALEGSRLKASVEEAGGLVLDFPDLASRMTAEINFNRLTIAEASKAGPIGNRAEINRWRSLVKAVFAQVAK